MSVTYQAPPLPKTELLSPAQAAVYCNLKATTLSEWTRIGRGPVHIKLGTRLRRYRKSDLDTWLLEHTRVPLLGESALTSAALTTAEPAPPEAT